jgi:hypothetical protein
MGRVKRALLLSLVLALSSLALASQAADAKRPKSKRHPAKAPATLALQSQTFQMSGADTDSRLTVACVGKKSLPYSGGMFGDPVGTDGAGVYPHSFERLGVQRGWHVSPILFAGSQRNPTRSVTLQVLCGPRLGPVSSPRSTVFVRPGESQTAVASCPPGNKLFTGGFQRTNFNSEGGAYVTESRMASDGSWQVSGSASGLFGGELTAIAYCLRARGPLVGEVSAETPLPPLKSATATTPGCPFGSIMVGGGFSTSPAGSTLIASAYFDPAGGWSTTGFNRFGPSATLVSRGYCMAAAAIRRRTQMRHGIRGPTEKSVQAPPELDTALKVAISERVNRDGCYPNPAELVAYLLAGGVQARIAGSTAEVQVPGVVYVLLDGASCDRVLLATRVLNNVVVLDSATGEVRLLQR